MRQKKKFELTLTPVNVEQKRNTYSTRMHSSRMRAARSSSRHAGVSTHPRSRHPPPGQIPLNFPLGCGPGPDPP